MIKKHKKIIYTAISAFFWISVWEILARAVDLPFIFPNLHDIVTAFLSLLTQKVFYLSVLGSVVRVLLGLLLGGAIGILLAAVTVKSPLFNSIISPVMSLFKTTPVASFIIILWFLFDKASIPIIISFIMVAPIIWESVKEALNVKNKDLYEVAEIFELTKKKKFRLLTVPTLLRYTLPALISASALAWKAGIAAEVITLAKQSIGGHISDAKNAFEGAEMFAWTITVIIMSVAIEKCIKILLKRVSKKWG